jgi:molybdenum cofactor synthesis domain-containing protein
MSRSEDEATPESAENPNAALLLIGSELLSGKVREANLQPLAEMLFRQGVKFERMVGIGDDLAQIANETQILHRTYTWVFTSGGVGPTHDDITMEAIANAFGCSSVVHPILKEMIQTRYGASCTEAHLRMARVPESAILETTQGEVQTLSDVTEWPAVRMQNVWILPGVPEAFRMKLSIIAAFLQRKHKGTVHGFVSVAVYTTQEESAVVPVLDALVAKLNAEQTPEHPSITVGSYPKWFDPSYKTKITFDGTDSLRVTRAAESFVRSLPPGTAWISTIPSETDSS